jgi:hypothetical protein
MERALAWGKQGRMRRGRENIIWMGRGQCLIGLQETKMPF